MRPADPARPGSRVGWGRQRQKGARSHETSQSDRPRVAGGDIHDAERRRLVREGRREQPADDEGHRPAQGRGPVPRSGRQARVAPLEGRLPLSPDTGGGRDDLQRHPCGDAQRPQRSGRSARPQDPGAQGPVGGRGDNLGRGGSHHRCTRTGGAAAHPRSGCLERQGQRSGGQGSGGPRRSDGHRHRSHAPRSRRGDRGLPRLHRHRSAGQRWSRHRHLELCGCPGAAGVQPRDRHHDARVRHGAGGEGPHGQGRRPQRRLRLAVHPRHRVARRREGRHHLR